MDGIHPAQFEAFIGRVLHRLNMLLGWAPGSKERVYTYQPEDYPLATSAVVGTQTQSTVQISSESAFIWTKSMAMVVGQWASGYSGRAIRDVLVQVIFGGTDQMMHLNSPGGHIENGWGNSDRPFVLPKPQFLKAATTLTIRTAATTTNARSIYFDLHGYKVWSADATKFSGAY